jgi:sugar phosphate isomerase/epimerase
MSYIYLASPYSHQDPAVREARWRAVCAVAARLMGAGLYVYSPIAHTHPIAEAGDLPKGWDYWQGFDRAMLAHAKELWVVTMEGWDQSAGVKAEVEIAQELGLPVSHIFQ